MFTVILYITATTLLIVSLSKDKERTKKGLKKSCDTLKNIMPQFLSIILTIGIMLSVLSPQDINILIGRQSGWVGMVIAAIVGSVTLIPGFVAFPLTAALYKSGGGIMQLAVFITTLMSVGIITLPVEIKYFGLKVSIIRNILAFAFSFVTAILMGVFLT